jgi:hypothetical protein
MIQDGPKGGKGLLLTPGFERVGGGLLSLPLEFKDADGEIAEAGQNGRACPTGRAAGILTESNVAAIMGAVLTA